jgi:uncharacterized membrane protein YfcA
MLDYSGADPAFLALLIAGLVATGLIAGILAGLLGVGGGIVIVPVLYAVLTALDVDVDVRMHVAVATSLATIIPTAISSARAHARKGAVDGALARSLAPWNFVGATGGAALAVSMGGAALGRVFGIIALLVAADLIRQTIRPPAASSSLAPRISRWVAAPIGAVIGFLSALMGIGGGTLAVPTLTYLGVPMHRAVATSAALGLVIALPSVVGYVAGGWSVSQLPPFSMGYVNVAGFALIAGVTFMSAPLGTRIAHAVSARALRIAFALFLTLTAMRMLLGG